MHSTRQYFAYLIATMSLLVIAPDAAARPEPQTERAKRLEKKCQAEDITACYELAHMYFDGEVTGWIDPVKASELFNKGTTINLQKALELSREGCDEGRPMDCLNLALVHADDNEEAVQLFEKACNGGNAHGCFDLGIRYYFGKGVTTDKAPS
jgi:TPR repeat protein